MYITTNSCIHRLRLFCVLFNFFVYTSYLAIQLASCCEVFVLFYFVFFVCTVWVLLSFFVYACFLHYVLQRETDVVFPFGRFERRLRTNDGHRRSLHRLQSFREVAEIVRSGVQNFVSLLLSRFRTFADQIPLQRGVPFRVGTQHGIPIPDRSDDRGCQRIVVRFERVGGGQQRVGGGIVRIQRCRQIRIAVTQKREKTRIGRKRAKSSVRAADDADRIPQISRFEEPGRDDRRSRHGFTLAVQQSTLSDVTHLGRDDETFVDDRCVDRHPRFRFNDPPC